MPAFSQASADKLATCDQRLQDIMNRAIKIVDFTVVVGRRGKAEQEQAFAEGKTQLHYPHGNHNANPSRAVDIAPYVTGSGIDWGDLIAFGRLMGVVQAIAFELDIKLRFGLDWDGDFRSVNRDPNEHFLDAPHVELNEP